MAKTGVEFIANLLEKTNLSESGVSFQGEKLKLDKEEDWDKIVDAIEKCDKMDFLNLEGNTLGVDASKAIAKALESKPELKRALWKDIFTGRMKEEIPKALLNLGSGLTLAGARLTELDMSDNAFGPIGVEGLAGLLSSPTCFQLQQLKLNNNGLGSSGGKMLSKALLQCYESSIKNGTPFALKVFIAGRNRLENEGAEALSKVFKTLGSLEEVALPQNGIYPKGIEALSKSFIKNPNLKIINLNDNTVTKNGAISIANALPHLQKLKVLNLGDCLLKTAGAEVLADALTRKHCELEELYMCFNEIKRSGGLAVAKAMENKSKLKLLSLNGNHFGTEGRNSLENVMKDNNRFESLCSLSENESEDEEDEDDKSVSDEDGSESEQEDDNDSESDKSLNNSQTSINSQNELNSEKTENDTDVLTNSIKNMSFDTKDNNAINTFMTSPTVSNFGGINKKLLADYIQKQKNSSLEFHIETLIPLIIKISSLSCCADEKVAALSLDMAFDLYRDLFAWASKEDKVSAVNNTLMVYLGLIKSEDKSFKINWAAQDSLSALKTAISKGIVPKSTENVLAFCLRTN